jgi:hypothetical protein
MWLADRDKFRGAPDNIVKRGLIISSADGEFRQLVEAGVRQLRRRGCEKLGSAPRGVGRVGELTVAAVVQ